MTPTNAGGFQEIFDAVQMDENAKKVFLAMPREEQLLAIVGMQAWMRSELVNIKRDVLETKKDLEESKKETLQYRVRRERQEKKLLGSLEGDDQMSTTQKIVREIAKEFSKRFDFWAWFRDKVLPAILTAIALGILYLVFGGK
jgi:hypothetical protein